ncbi:sensor histidine kinase [Paenibacillus glycanilyticus]|uniref:sensor histidine kinase n=1 Tax=Paenibacillus glycanilyticus TaxID=126569 RepID=UPI000FD7BC53|nr:HAMP domain-containing sensor histidine kinase [Paenibacillus glycanilyticus]
MFRNIRIKLAFFHSAAFLLILTALGAILYWHVHFRLYNDMDEILHQSESRIRATSNLDELLRSDFRELQQDERTTYLFWSKDGELIGQLPEQALSQKETQMLKPITNKLLQTVTIDHQSYRLLQISCREIKCNATIPVESITVVRSLRDVVGMLKNLQQDLAAGIAIGLLLSMAGGYYLAGRALVPIRQSWEKQQRFTADASHELRTPITIIQAQTEMLLRHPYHTIEEESSNISNILRESKRMGKLVDDLLTLTKGDTHDLALHWAPIYLDTVMNEVGEQFRLIAETKQIHVDSQVQPSIILWGDEERIRQVLLILLDNAYKFTPSEGSIVIEAHQTFHGIVIRISDTGIGIAPEDLAHVFERFYRGDKARTRSTGGTGLGLSIAEWIVKLHEGNIRIQSILGRGTTVEISFPGSNARIRRTP